MKGLVQRFLGFPASLATSFLAAHQILEMLPVYGAQGQVVAQVALKNIQQNYGRWRVEVVLVSDFELALFVAEQVRNRRGCKA